MRLTNKVLINLVNEMFQRLEIDDYEAFDVFTPKLKKWQEQTGAANIIIRYRKKDNLNSWFCLLIFYKRIHLQCLLNSGYILEIENGLNTYEDTALWPVKNTI